MFDEIDIKETELHDLYREAFNLLLRDHTRFNKFKKDNPQMTQQELDQHVDDPCNLIIWATDDYVYLGDEYGFHQPITASTIVGDNGWIIKPRCKKSPAEQTQRIKDKAEVFTPSWVCNVQNNLVDEVWFGKKGVFNEETVDEDGMHRWVTTKGEIEFPEGKTWKDYVRDIRLEITCGEAPYLCSRYDTTTGEKIALEKRIGLIDRKLRIVSEHCHTSGEWLKMAQEAYKSIYGYEWQGDNLLLARESLLCAFLEYYQAKFNAMPMKKSVEFIAYIISWNVWQMDGLKMVIPDSCKDQYETNLFGETIPKNCGACLNGDKHGHIGLTCYIRNWKRKKGEQDFTFSSLVQ